MTEKEESKVQLIEIREHTLCSNNDYLQYLPITEQDIYKQIFPIYYSSLDRRRKMKQIRDSIKKRRKNYPIRSPNRIL